MSQTPASTCFWSDLAFFFLLRKKKFVKIFYAFFPRFSSLNAIFRSVLSMSFISFSKWYTRNFSITLDFQLQTHSSDVCFLIEFCHHHTPLFWILKPGSSCKSIIALFLTWQFLFVVHTVFLSNFFPPYWFFYFTDDCVLLLSKVTYKGFLFFFFNWTFTLSLSGAPSYSFFLFVYS